MHLWIKRDRRPPPPDTTSISQMEMKPTAHSQGLGTKNLLTPFIIPSCVVSPDITDNRVRLVCHALQQAENYRHDKGSLLGQVLIKILQNWQCLGKMEWLC